MSRWLDVANSERHAHSISHQVRPDHHLTELRHSGCRFPAQRVAGLRKISEKKINLCWAEEFRVDFDELPIGFHVDPYLFNPLARPGNPNIDCLERLINEATNRLCYASRQNEGVRFGVLKH